MSERVEKNIEDWYEKTRAKDLEYLDLAETQLDLAKNLSVIHNKVCLLSKVSLKHFYLLEEENLRTQKEVVKLRQSVQNLEKDFVTHKPLTKAEVRKLVLEISKQPKLIEEEAVRLIEELKKNIGKIEGVLKEVKELIG